MIIGGQKCGTTSLAAQLGAHPGVSFCREKEPHWFSTVDAWEERLPEYHALYDVRDGALYGEASTSYTFLPEYPDVHERLHRYNPHLKLIYIVRHPVKRVISQCAHDMIRGRIKGAYEEHVLRDPMYVNRTRYAHQIQAYLDCFPREQVRILLFEEYVKDPRGALRTLGEFLGLAPEPFETIDVAPRNISAKTGYLKNFPGAATANRVLSKAPGPIRRAGSKLLLNRIDEKPEFRLETRRAIWNMLEADVAALAKIMDRPLDLWQPPHE
ncbi:MAG: hypothetical protein HKN20_10215 [Gemmatimonadetes bacterium]|nr:hypothetical protein [Gemmatimonadota bacterium]